MLRIKEILGKKNITAKELATKIGMSETSLSRIVSGKQNPSINTLEKIAKILNVGVGDLFSKSNEPIISFDSLTPEQQRKLKEMTTDVYGLERLSGEPLSFKEYHVLKMALQGIFGNY